MNRRFSLLLFIVVSIFVPVSLDAQVTRQIGTFQKAIALAINPSLNEFYVVDANNGKIFRMDYQGKILSNVGGFGVQREGFDSPRDIATDGVNVYIADRGNQRVSHYDRYLHFIALLQNRPDASRERSNESVGSLSSQVWRPTSVSISPQGDLFLLDEAQQQAIRINPFNFSSLQQQKQNPIQYIFGGFNSGNGRLFEPNRLQASKSGKIFISDEGAKCLFVYDLFGNFVAQIGKSLLRTPLALACGEVMSVSTSGEKTLKEWLLVVDENQIFIFATSIEEGFKVIGMVSATEVRRLVGENGGNLMDLGVTANEIYLLTERKLIALPIESLKIEMP